MHRTNLSTASVTEPVQTRHGRLAVALGSDDLLDAPTDLSLELMEELPANSVDETLSTGMLSSVSDATCELLADLDELEPSELLPAEQRLLEALAEDEEDTIHEPISSIRRRDAIRPPSHSDFSVELAPEELEEEVAPVESRQAELIDILLTSDLEVVPDEPAKPAAAQAVLFCCRPGDSLPAYAEYTEELPRFSMSSKRKRPGQFIPAPVAEVREIRSRRIPAVRLPSFGIDEHPAPPRSRIPAPKLPKFIIE